MQRANKSTSTGTAEGGGFEEWQSEKPSKSRLSTQGFSLLAYIFDNNVAIFSTQPTHSLRGAVFSNVCVSVWESSLVVVVRLYLILNPDM